MAPTSSRPVSYTHLEGGHADAELLALLGVLGGLLHAALADANAEGAHAGPAVVQGLQNDLEAPVLAAQHVVLGDPDVVKDDLAGAAQTHAHLVLFLADGHAGTVPLHDEGGEAHGSGLLVGGGQHGVDAGLSLIHISPCSA